MHAAEVLEIRAASVASAPPDFLHGTSEGNASPSGYNEDDIAELREALQAQDNELPSSSDMSTDERDKTAKEARAKAVSEVARISEAVLQRLSPSSSAAETVPIPLSDSIAEAAEGAATHYSSNEGDQALLQKSSITGGATSYSSIDRSDILEIEEPRQPMDSAEQYLYDEHYEMPGADEDFEGAPIPATGSQSSFVPSIGDDTDDTPTAAGAEDYGRDEYGEEDEYGGSDFEDSDGLNIYTDDGDSIEDVLPSLLTPSSQTSRPQNTKPGAPAKETLDADTDSDGSEYEADDTFEDDSEADELE
jgi:hypothetical protein